MRSSIGAFAINLVLLVIISMALLLVPVEWLKENFTTIDFTSEDHFGVRTFFLFLNTFVYF